MEVIECSFQGRLETRKRLAAFEIIAEAG